jgi:hypothetical protein
MPVRCATTSRSPWRPRWRFSPRAAMFQIPELVRKDALERNLVVHRQQKVVLADCRILAAPSRCASITCRRLCAVSYLPRSEGCRQPSAKPSAQPSLVRRLLSPRSRGFRSCFFVGVRVVVRFLGSAWWSRVRVRGGVRRWPASSTRMCRSWTSRGTRVRVSPRRVRGRTERATLRHPHRPVWATSCRTILQPCLDEPARVRVDMAQRWRTGHPDRRVGGHSVEVLMRVYAKCIYGQEQAARRRIEAALAADDSAMPDT